MRKKVLPFPAPRQQVETAIACHHSRVNVRVGTQRFAIDITAQATILPSEPPRPVQHLRVETRYLSLGNPSPWATALTVGESAGWEVGTAAKCFSW